MVRKLNPSIKMTKRHWGRHWELKKKIENYAVQQSMVKLPKKSRMKFDWNLTRKNECVFSSKIALKHQKYCFKMVQNDLKLISNGSGMLWELEKVEI